MRLLKAQNKVVVALAVVLLAGQLAFSFSFLLVPKRAEAFLGFGDLNIKIGDIPGYIEKVVQGVLVSLGTQYANKYLTKFVQKLQDKYRIKDFLFYDQYLSDYYVTNLITRNVDDPDLRRALELFTGITVTGRTGGYHAGICRNATADTKQACRARGGQWDDIDPRKALIPQLKAKINDLYKARTGVDYRRVYYPARRVSDREYFSTAQSFFYNHPSFTESNLYAQFSAFESSATTASRLEVAVGSGLKNGRIIGGTCARPAGSADDADIFDAIAGGNPPKDPVSCNAAGGHWEASALDQARSFITNPTAFTEKQLVGAVDAIFKNNYDASNIYTQIGRSLGNFIFTSLNLNESGSGFSNSNVFNEGGEDYDPNSTDDFDVSLRVIDLDGDGIPDGEDNDEDRELKSLVDLCYHDAKSEPGEEPLVCNKSSETDYSEYLSPVCKATDNAILALDKWSEFQETHKNEAKNTTNFWNDADSSRWGDVGSEALSYVEKLVNELKKSNVTQYDGPIRDFNRYAWYLDAIVRSLFGNNDVDLRTGPGSGDGGTFFSSRVRTANILDYAKDFRARISKCEQPDLEAIEDLPPPDLEFNEPPDTEFEPTEDQLILERLNELNKGIKDVRDAVENIEIDVNINNND
ncbi:MAG: hypothetical protein HYV13_03370 [Candidatus Doudnabacteria bacterium]|nr:hypothetical protein [Candidatus Doudnabacteria bacterium]